MKASTMPDRGEKNSEGCITEEIKSAAPPGAEDGKKKKKMKNGKERTAGGELWGGKR